MAKLCKINIWHEEHSDQTAWKEGPGWLGQELPSRMEKGDLERVLQFLESRKGCARAVGIPDAHLESLGWKKWDFFEMITQNVLSV